MFLHLPRRALRAVCRALIAFQILVPGVALANPQGGTVVSGSAAITEAGSAMTVHQHTDRAIVDWRSFSNAAGESVRFAQPGATSVILNRVTGREGSVIDGALSANGRVFLLNPNGIVFGKTATVNTAGLVASTLNMANEDFMAGRYKLSQDPARPHAAVVNRGRIETATGGSVVLVAPLVSNEGTIFAPGGSVALAAGTEAIVTMDDRGLVNVGVKGKPTGPVVVPREAVSELLETVVNNGHIGEGTAVRVSANGEVEISGAGGAVVQAGRISVDAPGQAGRVRVESTRATLLTPGSVVTANGARGGDVRALSEGRTVFAKGARLEAKGAGFVEVSGKSVVVDGAVDTRGGMFLIDPANIRITNGSGATQDNTELSFNNNGSADDDAIIGASDGGGSTFQVSEQRLEQLAADGNDVVLEATCTVVLSDLTDDELDMTSGIGGSITLRTLLGSISFDDANDRIRVDGADSITVQAGTQAGANANATLGRLAATGGSISVTAGLCAGNVQVADITNTCGGTVSLTAPGGSITTTGGTIAAAAASLTAGTGIDVDVALGGAGTGVISASTTTGDITIDQTGNLRVDGLTVTTANAGDISLTTSGRTFLNGDVTAVGRTVDIDANVGGANHSITRTTGTITADTLDICSSSGDVGQNCCTTAIRTDVNHLHVVARSGGCLQVGVHDVGTDGTGTLSSFEIETPCTTPAVVRVRDTSGARNLMTVCSGIFLRFGAGGAANKTYRTRGCLCVQSAGIAAGDDITATSSNGNVTVGNFLATGNILIQSGIDLAVGDITAAAGKTVTLSASEFIVSAGGTLVAPGTAILTAGKGIGATPGNGFTGTINTQVGTLQASVTTNGGAANGDNRISVTNTGNLILSGVSTVDGTITVKVTAGTLAASGAVTANGSAITLQTLTAGKDIDIGGALNACGSTLVLDSGGSILGSGSVSGAIVVLTAAGSIGSACCALDVDAAQVSASVTGASSSIVLADVAGGNTLNSLSLSTCAADFGPGGVDVAVIGAFTETCGTFSGNLGAATLSFTNGGLAAITLDGLSGAGLDILNQGSIAIGAGDVLASCVALTAVQSSVTRATGGVVTAGSLVVSAATGIVLDTAATCLDLEVTGNGSIDVNNDRAASTTLSARALGTGNVTFDQTGGGALELAAGGVAAANGNVELTSTNSIGGGAVAGTDVDLVACNGIGTCCQRVDVDGASVHATVFASDADIFLTDVVGGPALASLELGFNAAAFPATRLSVDGAITFDSGAGTISGTLTGLDLVLSNAGGATLTFAGLTTGDLCVTTGGSIAVAGAVSAGALDLCAGGAVSGAGVITASSVAARAGCCIDLHTATTSLSLDAVGGITLANVSAGDASVMRAVSCDAILLCQSGGGRLFVQGTGVAANGGDARIDVACNDLMVQAPVSAFADVELHTTGVLGGVFVEAPVDASANMVITAVGAITTAGAGKLLGADLCLTTSGSIDVDTAADVVEAVACGGVRVDNLNGGLAVQYVNILAVCGDVTLTNDGQVEIVGTAEAQGNHDFTIVTTAGGAIVNTSGITAVGNTVRLNAGGSITGAATILANLVDLDAAGGITAQVNAATLDADSSVSGAIDIESFTSITFSSVSSADGLVQLTAAGTLTIGACGVTAGGSNGVELTATGGGGIALDGDVNACGGTAVLDASAGIAGAGSIFATCVDLDAGGAITAHTKASGVDADAGGAVNVDNSTGAAVGFANVTGTCITLSNDGDLQVGGITAASAGGVLVSTTNGGAIAIDTAVTATTSITLAAAGALGGAGSAAATTVTLDSGGSIGTSGNPFDVNAATLDAATTSATGSIFLADVAGGPVLTTLILGTSTASFGATDVVVSGASSFAGSGGTFSGTLAGTSVTLVNSGAACATLCGLAVGSLNFQTGGSIAVGPCDVNAAGNVALTSGGAVAGAATGTIFASSVTVDAASGIAVDTHTDALDLDVTGNGAIDVDNTNCIGAVALTARVLGTGDITVDQTGSNALAIAAGGVSAANGTALLTSQAGISGGGGTVAGGTVTLTAAGSIGSSGARVGFDAANLIADTTGANASIFLTDVVGTRTLTSLTLRTTAGNFGAGGADVSVNGATTLTETSGAISTNLAGKSFTLCNDGAAALSLDGVTASTLNVTNRGDVAIGSGGATVSGLATLASVCGAITNGSGTLSAAAVCAQSALGLAFNSATASLSADVSGLGIIDIDNATNAATTVGKLRVLAGGGGFGHITFDHTGTGGLTIAGAGVTAVDGCVTLTSTAASGGGLTVDAAVFAGTGGEVTLQAITSGAVTLNASVTSNVGQITVVATGAGGAITGSGTLNAPTAVHLDASGTIDVHTLTAALDADVTGTGDLVVANTTGAALQLDGVSTANGDVTVTHDGNLTVAGAVTAGGAGNQVSLCAAGGITGAGLISANTALLCASTGLAASVDVRELSAVNGVGCVTLSATGDLDILGISTTAGNVTLNAGGGQTRIRGDITALGNTVDINTVDGGLSTAYVGATPEGVIRATTTHLDVEDGHLGLFLAPAATFAPVATQVTNLITRVSGGSFPDLENTFVDDQGNGTLTSIDVTTGSTITCNGGGITANSVQIRDQGGARNLVTFRDFSSQDPTLNISAPAGTDVAFTFTRNDNIDVSATSGRDVTLTTTLAGWNLAGISISGCLAVTTSGAGKSINLLADTQVGAGCTISLTASADIAGAGALRAGSGVVNLTAGQGIGRSGAINTQTGALTAFVTTDGGAVNGDNDIDVSNTGALNLSCVSTIDGGIRVAATGALTVPGAVDVGGSTLELISGGALGGPGSLAGASVTLTAAGSIGSPGDALDVDAGVLSASTTGTNASIYLDDVAGVRSLTSLTLVTAVSNFGAADLSVTGATTLVETGGALSGALGGVALSYDNNGTGALTLDGLSGCSLTLQNDGNLIVGANDVSGTTVTLQSINGNVDSAAGGLVAATALVVDAATGITLGAAATSLDLDVTGNGALCVDNTTGAAATLVARTLGNGSLRFDQAGGGDLLIGCVSVTNGIATLTSTAGIFGAGTVSAATVCLLAATSIGTGGARVSADASTLIAEAGTGNLFLTDVAGGATLQALALTVNTANFGAAGTDVSVNGATTLTETSGNFAGTLTGVGLVLDNDGSAQVILDGLTADGLNVENGGNITIGASDVTVAGTATLDAAGAVGRVAGGLLTAGSVVVDAGTGINLDTATTNLDLDVACGSIAGLNTSAGTATLNACVLGGGGITFQQTGGGALAVGCVRAPGVVALTTSAGIDGGGTVTAGLAVCINAAGSVGSSGSRLGVDGSFVGVRTSGANASIFLDDVAGGATLTCLQLATNASNFGAGGADVSVTGATTLTETNGSFTGTLTGVGLVLVNTGAATITLDGLSVASLFACAGGITIGASDVTSACGVTLRATGAISRAAGGLVSTGFVDARAGTGITLDTAAAFLDLEVTGSGAIDVDNTSACTTSLNALVSGAGSITVDQAGGGSLDICGCGVTATNGAVALSSTAGICGDGVVSGTTVTLVAAGSIGSVSCRVGVDASTVSATTAGVNADVSLDDVAGGRVLTALTLRANVASFCVADVSVIGAITLNETNGVFSGCVNAALTLDNNGSATYTFSSLATASITAENGGGIVIGACGLSAAGAASLTSTGGTLVRTCGGSISASSVTGVAAGGIALNILASTSSFDVTGNGSIDVVSTVGSPVAVTLLRTQGTGPIAFDQLGGGAVTFTTVSANDGAVTLTNTCADLVVGGAVTVGGTGHDATLRTITSGNVVLTGTVSAGGDSVNVCSAGAIDGAGLVTAGTVDLDACGGIGATTALNLAAATLSIDNACSGAIDVNNALGTAVTVASLTAAGAGSITFDQSGGGPVTFSGATTTDGAITLRSAGGNLTVGGLVQTGNDLAVTLSTSASGNVSLGAPVSAGAGLATVSAAGNISGAGTITAACVDLGAGGSITAQTVSPILNATAGGAITIADQLGSAQFQCVTTTNGSVSLSSTGALQVVGSVSAGGAGSDLALTGTTDVLVNGTAAAVDAVTVTACGGIQGLATYSGAAVSLTARTGIGDAGTIGVSAASVAATNLCAGDIVFTIAGPSSATLTNLVGSISVGSNAALSIAGATTCSGILSLTGASLAFTGDASTGADTVGRILLSTCGGITQTAGSTLTAGELFVDANGAAVLGDAGNDIGALAAAGAGSLTFNDVDDLVVGTVAGVNGIAMCGNVTLGSGTTLTQTAAGLVSGVRLTVTGAGVATLDQANDVDLLAASVTGSLTFNDVDTLTTLGITAGNQDLTLTTGGDLTIGGVATAIDTATLTSAASILSGGGRVEATHLFLSAVTDIGSDALPVTMDTSTASLTATAGGLLIIRELNDARIAAATAGTRISITSVAGNLIFGTIDAPAAALTTLAGSLLDGNGAGVNITTAGDLTLSATGGTIGSAAQGLDLCVGGTLAVAATGLDGEISANIEGTFSDPVVLTALTGRGVANGVDFFIPAVVVAPPVIPPAVTPVVVVDAGTPVVGAVAQPAGVDGGNPVVALSTASGRPAQSDRPDREPPASPAVAVGAFDLPTELGFAALALSMAEEAGARDRLSDSERQQYDALRSEAQQHQEESDAAYARGDRTAGEASARRALAALTAAQALFTR